MVYILCNKAQIKKLPEINNYCRLNVKKKNRELCVIDGDF